VWIGSGDVPILLPTYAPGMAAAFNTATAQDRTYVRTVDQSQSVDGMISFRNQTGGFELLSIESSEPLHIRFRVKEKGGLTTRSETF